MVEASNMLINNPSKVVLGTLIATLCFAAAAEGEVKPFKFPVELIGNTPRAKATNQEVIDKSDFLNRIKASQNAVQVANGTPVVKQALPLGQTAVTTNEAALESARRASFTQSAPRPQSFIDKIKSAYKSKQNLGTLEPGDNLAIPVAAGITNPIITNFKRVAIRTHDEEAVIELEDGRVYITLNNMRPIGLMLFEEGVPESMINLTLVPVDAMPVVVNFKVNMTKAMKVKSWKYRAKVKEEEAISQVQQASRKMLEADHITYIKSILKPIGNAQLPRGFTLSTDTSQAMAKPCSITIEQKVAQRIVGLREVVDVVRVKNNLHYGYMLEEQACESKGTIAVAIYNKAYLQPGEATEIYIMRDKLQSSQIIQKTSRPRVVK